MLPGGGTGLGDPPGDQPDHACILGVTDPLGFMPSIGWISRWPLAFIIGYGSFNVIYIVQTFLLPQICHGMITPLVEIREAGRGPLRGALHGAGSWSRTVSNLVLFLGVLSVIACFFFSKAHTGSASSRASASGCSCWRFGATYGNTVMARMLRC